MSLVPSALHIPVAFTKPLHPTPAGLESSTAFPKDVLGTILLGFFKRLGQETRKAQLLAVLFTGFHCLSCSFLASLIPRALGINRQGEKTCECGK